MENVIYRKDYERYPDNYKFVDLENLNSLITENIENICICDNEIVSFNDRKLVNEITDSLHPLVLKKTLFKDGYTLTINSKWYLENNQLVDKLVENIISNSINSKISIDSSVFITDSVIDCLCSNKNLEDVSLCRFKSEDPFVLNIDSYKKFKSSDIKCVYTTGVSDELKDNFDSIIGYNATKSLIGYNIYSDLVSGKKIYIDSIKDEELENFKYLSNDTVIQLNDDIDFIKVINYFKSVGKNSKVIINVEDKNKFNEQYLDIDFGYNNLEIITKSIFDAIPFDFYKRSEKILLDMIEPCKNLSPFEKYIYIYNTVKQFKKYKEVDNEDKMHSRDLYEILYNEYMVCVGFSTLFGDLLDKVGIENKDLGIDIDLSYDSVKDSTQEIEISEDSVKHGGHDRRYVHIVDPKYGIDGFYVSDPTWDNNRNMDLYNHIAMTDREVTTGDRYVFVSNENEIFDISSKEEYYEKLNFIIGRPNSIGQYPNKKRLLIDIVGSIKKVDNNFYNELIKEYPSLGNWDNYDKLLYNSDADKYYHPIFEKIGDYLLDHVNKEISAETLFAAVTNVYKKAYDFSDEEISKMIPKIINDNKEMQELVFPTRYKIGKDGLKEMFMNEENKFDIDSEKIM